MGRTGASSSQVCEIKLHQNFSQGIHPIHSIGPQNSYFGVFRTILLLLESLCKTDPIGATNAQVCETKLRRNFVVTKTPDPLHLTKNSCFMVFQTISLLKIDAKRVELVPYAQVR
jgi:hypothetical protein